MTSTTGLPGVRTRPRPECDLCGAPGDLIHEGLTDRLFGAPGVWDFRRCPAPGCGLVWLDPAPLEEDVLELYRGYYTHHGAKGPGSPDGEGLVRRSLRRFYHALLRPTPIWRERRRLRLMYLDATVPGRLLDIGCGSGDRMAELEAMGWKAEGQEIDPEAAAQARARGLTVHLGDLESLGLPPASYDAVVANHVLEHVHDPAGLLGGCRRLLRPGGKLVAVTPNAESHCHRRYGASWRGLEPPRHLRIFAPRTLRTLASEESFEHVAVWTTAANAQTIAVESLRLSRGDQAPAASPPLIAYLAAVPVQIHAWLDWRRHPQTGEECVLEVIR